MAKKKDKQQVVNCIEEIKLEIDYDKLANMIVERLVSKEIINENDDKKDCNEDKPKSKKSKSSKHAKKHDLRDKNEEE